jgi:hypothetical protein
MSDKIKINSAIDKAATECVEELENAGHTHGGAACRQVVKRRMKALLDAPPVEPATAVLRVENCLFEKFRGGIKISRYSTSNFFGRGASGKEHDTESSLLDAASAAKLARWLNGGE